MDFALCWTLWQTQRESASLNHYSRDLQSRVKINTHEATAWEHVHKHKDTENIWFLQYLKYFRNILFIPHNNPAKLGTTDPLLLMENLRPRKGK